MFDSPFFQITVINNLLHGIFDDDVTVTDARRIHGGDINDAYCLLISNGERVFLKVNSEKGIDLLSAEMTGLEAIRKTDTISVPRPLQIGSGETGSSVGYLMLEYIVLGAKTRDFWINLGHRLADMHRTDVSYMNPDATYGFKSDGYIGTSLQANITNEVDLNWTEFFKRYRIRPQLLRAAGRYFQAAERKLADRFLEKTNELLEEPNKPSLIHGDLWGGNIMASSDGEPYIIDPAAYIGHREADIAMTELFGGFPQVFYDAYNEAWPLDPDYKDRRDIYNLYHLLNHLNIFGVSYLSSVVSIMKRYAG